MSIDPTMMLAAAQDVPTLVKTAWLIPAFPVATFLLLILIGRRVGDPIAGWIASIGMFASFVMSVLAWIGLARMPGDGRLYEIELFTWMGASVLHVDLGFLIDPLSVTMSLFVSLIATLVFVYSIGYMKGDPDYSKFFIYLAFFAMSMLILVNASSLLVTFLGWEGVGAASWFLIGFWFQGDENASAGKKAFVTNRVGDWGFLVAMFFAFLAFGTFNYTDMFANLGPVATTTLSAIAVFLLIGAIGKSSQIPLYLWLPDAMAGPTPVSALMHAATMVVAGVYLLIRINPIIGAADPWVATLIAIVGAATAIFAATVAIAQNDIKKVLAYSTVSQLGYMVMAIGSGAYVAATFHMITHAFFKGLLFLGAGAVIHGMRSEQDMNWYGRLWKFFPITGVCFVIATLAIAGVPPFSGFWSKGDILTYAWNKSPALWVVGIIAALCTAYYMTRELIMTFFGQQRWTELDPRAAQPDGDEATESADGPAPATADPAEAADADGALVPTGPGAPHQVIHGAPVEPREAPWVMTVPMIVLAVGSVVLGVINLPFMSGHGILTRWLEPSVFLGETAWFPSAGLEWALEIIVVLLTLAGIGAAYLVYQRITDRDTQRRYEPELLAKSYYYDIAVSWFMGNPVRRASEWLAFTFEWYVIDGAVNGTARLLGIGAYRARRVQTGYVRNYALGLTAGAALLLIFVLYRASF